MEYLSPSEPLLERINIQSHNPNTDEVWIFDRIFAPGDDRRQSVLFSWKHTS